MLSAAAGAPSRLARLFSAPPADRGPSAAPGIRQASATQLLMAAIVFCAAVPFAGWRIPTAWAAGMFALVAARHIKLRPGPDGAAPTDTGRPEPLTWLIKAGYSAAALYLVLFFDRAAQSLGVTLFGVVMLQVLARDYAAPRRLMLNLIPPLLSLAVVQAVAAARLVAEDRAWQIVTLLAIPAVVFITFRTVQTNLNRSRNLEREARAGLQESETRYRLLAEASPDVIIRYDLDGRIEYVSPAARTYGYEPQALTGRHVREFLAPADWPRNDEFLAALAEGRPLPQGSQSHWNARGADGASITFEGATSPLQDDRGRAIGALSILRDVTGRLELEEELRRRSAEAEAAAVAKSQFLANMSHEIRTPLTGVIGFAGILESMSDLTPEARRYASRIQTSAEALLSVVNDVLDFSKLEANHVELDPQPFELRGFLDGAVDLVRHQAEDKGLRLETGFPDDLPPTVLADSARLRQVLLNLLSNATKFTHRGRIRVTAEYADGELRLAVQDTGIGIPPDVAGRLFQRFSQVDGSSTRQHGGSGLGLAISKGLVEMMGGEIGMESAPGAGSTFWFRIAAPAVAPVERAARPGRAPAADFSRVRVLVVDDVAVNRELVAALLGPFNADVFEASSGAEAVQVSLDTPFDVILMDLQMPGMDGMAATAAIRANSDLNRATPILALSANVLPEHVEACLRGGMNDHVAKPIEPRDLLTKIVRWTTPAAEDAASPAASRTRRRAPGARS